MYVIFNKGYYPYCAVDKSEAEKGEGISLKSQQYVEKQVLEPRQPSTRTHAPNFHDLFSLTPILNPS